MQYGSPFLVPRLHRGAGVVALAAALAMTAAAQGDIVQTGVRVGDSRWHREAFVEVAAGPSHTLARRDDGTVVAWGENNQFGNQYGRCAVPALPAGRRYTAIAAGASHSLALRSDGAIVAFGSNNEGQCNVPPLPLGPGAPVWVGIAAGAVHSVALRSDGRVFAFGSNVQGQCNVPAAAQGSYVEIGAGAYHTVARSANGTVVAFGFNLYGQCNVPAGTYAEVAGGAHHTVVRRTNGTVVAFGHNLFGQCNVPAGTYVDVAAGGHHTLLRLANGTVVAIGLNAEGQCNVPAAGQGSYVEVAAGWSHSLVRRSDGSVLPFGSNRQNQCNVPPLPGGATYVAVSAGDGHVLALRSDGAVVAWGESPYGQANAPTGLGYVEIAAGSHHSVARRSDGSVVAWGSNHYGQTVVPAGTYVEIAAGCAHSVARRSDGSVVAWGANHYGQTVVPAGTYVQIAAGHFHTVLRRVDGTVVAFGYNGRGQCNVPLLPAGVTYVDIEAGPNHSLARRSDGVVVGWGEDYFGMNSPPPLPSGQSFLSIDAALRGNSFVIDSAPVAVANSILPPSGAKGFTFSAWDLWSSGTATSGTDMRFQAVYSAATMPPGRIKVTRLLWRAAVTPLTFTGGTWSDVTVRMCTSPNRHTALDPLFASNLGADLTTVYRGPVTIPPHGGTVPTSWYVDLPLATPFEYDAARGDVLIELSWPAGTWSGGTCERPVVDSNLRDPALPAGFVYSTAPGATSGAVRGHGLLVGIEYVPDPRGADKATFGTSCQNGLFYELWTPASTFDLAGQAIRMERNAFGGYRVRPVPLGFVPPTSPPLLQNRTLSDPVTLPFTFGFPGGSTDTIRVCEKGYVGLDPSDTVVRLPSTADDILNHAPRLAVAWAHWNTATSGSAANSGNGAVHYDVVGGVVHVTWLGVGAAGVAPAYGGPTATTFQCKMFADGAVEYHWVPSSVDRHPAHELIVGIKPGPGTYADPGSSDLSNLANAPIDTFGTTAAGLRLDADQRPRIGSLLSIDTTRIPAGANATVTWIAFAPRHPSLELTPRGMPACWFHLPDSAYPLGARFGQPAISLPLYIPTVGVAIGARLWLQSFTQVPGINAGACISSNALELRIGT
jgi:alpha-tubulin suppressor-like RCC1 family protein